MTTKDWFTGIELIAVVVCLLTLKDALRGSVAYCRVRPLG